MNIFNKIFNFNKNSSKGNEENKIEYISQKLNLEKAMLVKQQKAEEKKLKQEKANEKTLNNILNIYKKVCKLIQNQEFCNILENFLSKYGFIPDIELFSLPMDINRNGNIRLLFDGVSLFDDNNKKYIKFSKQGQFIAIDINENNCYQNLTRSILTGVKSYGTLRKTYNFFENACLAIRFDKEKEFVEHEKLLIKINKKYHTNKESSDENYIKKLSSVKFLYKSFVSTKLLIDNEINETVFYLLLSIFNYNKLFIDSNKIIKKYELDNNIEKIEYTLVQKGIDDEIIKTYIASQVLSNKKDITCKQALLEASNILMKIKVNVKQKDFIDNLINFDENAPKITISDIDIMSGIEFENCIANMFKRMGYETLTTKTSGDQGIDVIAKTLNNKIAIQVKCYSGMVSNSAIQEAIAGMKYYDANMCMVVTNSFFTKSAKDLAKVNNVELWDRTILIEKLKEIY